MGMFNHLSNSLGKYSAALLYGREALSKPVSPFVLGRALAHQLVKQLGPPLVVATFDGQYNWDISLGGKFLEGAITSEQLTLAHPPGVPTACQRLRFTLPAGRDHGELFVSVRDNVNNWKFFQVFNLWYRACSRGGKLFVSFMDAEGQRWFFPQDNILRGGDWCLLRVPFTYFDCPSRPEKDAVQHREKVSQVTFQVACNEGSPGCTGYVDFYQAFLSH